jgi:hypothetical protein
MVTLNGNIDILSVAFYGLNDVPDSGTTFALLGIVVLGLFLIKPLRGRAAS